MKHTVGILVATYAVGLLCSPTYASTTLATLPPSFSALPGSTGNAFDVVLTNNGPTSISVQSFSFQVSVTDTDLTLTGADFSTGATPYIFAGDSFDVINGFGLNTDGPGLTMNGSDGTNDFVGITLTSGESFALGRVLFSVSPTAALGAFAISFTGTPTVADGNNLSDPTGAAINIDNFSSGTINVVPEPSSFLLMLTGTATLAAFLRRRRA